jgi:hypothetical protein
MIALPLRRARRDEVRVVVDLESAATRLEVRAAVFEALVARGFSVALDGDGMLLATRRADR